MQIVMPADIFKSKFQDLVSLYKPETLTIWELSSSDDILTDFLNFTDAQGGKSDDPKDSEASNLPPASDKDGRTYHTIRDVSWDAYCHIMQSNGITPTSDRFYSMSDTDKKLVIKFYFNVGHKTTSALVNSLIAFLYWGGSASATINRFENDNGSIQSCINKYGEKITFDMLMIERIHHLQLLNPYYTKVWTKGLLCFWKLFNGY